MKITRVFTRVVKNDRAKLSYVRWCERRSGNYSVVTRLLDVCCELSRDTVTEIKMEVGLPVRAFRGANQTASMMC